MFPLYSFSRLAHVLDVGIPALKEKYSRRFEEMLPPPPGTPSSLIEFSKTLTSNLLAGVGYFYGESVVDKNFAYDWDQDEDAPESKQAKQSNAELTEPKSLLTATPSRSFFPRGFYWSVSKHTILLNHRIHESDFGFTGTKVFISCISELGTTI